MKISDEKIIETEQLLTQNNPFYPLERGHLYIRTKSAELVVLKPNQPQRMILDKIRKLRRERKRVRIWILKARQEGVSTIAEAIIFSLTAFKENVNSLIMADEDDKATNLFSITKLFQEQLEKNEPHLARKLKKSNEKALEFEDTHAKIIIETAHNIDAARSYTFQYVHLSECAFYRDLKGVLTGLNQSVPDLWDTVVIGETTANGREEFYGEWMKAIKGETDWIPLFIPWFWMDEYSMPLQAGGLCPLAGVTFGTGESSEKFLEDEAKLQAENNLTDEQINWRRWAIINKCQGDINTFRQEYPASWEEAFIMSGSLYFDRKSLEYQEKWLKKPKRIGELFYQNMKWEFRDLERGRIRIYEEPDELGQYIVALDASEGLPTGDEAAGIVLNKRTNTTAADLSGQFDTEQLAELGIALGNWYNKAMIAPENKGYGNDVIKKVNAKYGNIYKRKKYAKGNDEETEELGFNTNSVTRPSMLANLDSELKNQSTLIQSRELWSELMTFVQEVDAKGNALPPRAAKGCQDGLVICRAIAGMVRNEHPYITKPSNKASANASRYQEIIRQRKNAGISFNKR